ncbi:MAG: AbrB/MazE/SpoVT family DNA-binding domain-containing protein [Acidimicrobiales bacterium]
MARNALLLDPLKSTILTGVSPRVGGGCLWRDREPEHTREAWRQRSLYSRCDIVKAMARVSSKNQVTLSVAALRAAGLEPGDEVTVRPIGASEIVIAARGSRVRRHAGIATGIYEPGELDNRLRDEWDR